MNIKLIKSKKDHREALKRVEGLWNVAHGSKEGDELDLLAALIEKYENEHYAIGAPNPVEALKFRMEQLGMEQKDLAKIIGANRASEMLGKKRPMSLNIIRILHKKLNIPAESLIGN